MNKRNEFFGILALIAGALMFAYAVSSFDLFGSIESVSNVLVEVEMLLITFLIATVFVSYLVTHAENINYKIRFVAIPLWLAFTMSLVITIDKFFGYPYPVLPPPGQVISYRPVLMENNERKLEAWIFNREEGKSRLYIFNWEEEREEKLKQAMNMLMYGQETELTMSEGDTSAGSETVGGDNTLHPIKHKGLPPKVYTNEPTENQRSSAMSAPAAPSNSVTLTTDGGSVQIPKGTVIRVDQNGQIEIMDGYQDRGTQLNIQDGK